MAPAAAAGDAGAARRWTRAPYTSSAVITEMYSTRVYNLLPLQKLQIYKSLADLEAGSAMYNGYSAVPPEMVALREIVMARKESRKLLVQPHIEPDGQGGHALRNFVPTPAGMIESFVARFPPEDPELLALYENEKQQGM